MTTCHCSLLHFLGKILIDNGLSLHGLAQFVPSTTDIAKIVTVVHNFLDTGIAEISEVEVGNRSGQFSRRSLHWVIEERDVCSESGVRLICL